MFYIRWWPFSRWTNWYARWQGRSDARKNFPPKNAERALGYPAEVERVANQHLTTIDKRYNKRDRIILERLKHHIVTRVAAKKELDEAELQYKDEPRRTSIGRTAHNAGLLFFAVADLPLNLPPFEYYFPEALPFDWFLAFGVGAALVFLAYFDGKLLREPNRTKQENRILAGVTTLACVIICAIAVVRQKVLANDTGNDVAGTIGFVFLQFLIFFAAAFLSFVAHAPLRDKRAAYHAASSAVDRLRVQRDKLYKAHRAGADGVVQIAHFLNSSYEGENVKHRDGAIIGLRPIAPTLPNTLATMLPELDTRGEKVS